MIALTEDERRRFADWLDQEAADDALLVGELAKFAPPLAQARQAEIDAQRLIAKKLRAVETKTL